MESDVNKVNTIRHKPFAVPADEVMLDPDIRVSGPAYPLCEAEYLILSSKAPSGFIFSVANVCLGVGVSYAIVVAAKYFDAIIDKTSVQIESWEKWVVIISIGLSFICFVLFIFLPSKKKKLLKAIRERVYSQAPEVESRRKDNGHRGDCNAI